jgi:hypothetical protein
MALAILYSLMLAWTPAGAQSQIQPDASLIRVRVETDEGGVPEELAARRESVTQLVAAIRANKKSGLLIVTRADDPVDIVVEVMDRGITVPKVVIGLSGGMRSPTGRTPPVAETVKAVQLRVTVRLARDGEPVEIKNKNRANDTESGWTSAAKDIAKQVDKWIVEHRADILEARRSDRARTARSCRTARARRRRTPSRPCRSAARSSSTRARKFTRA